MKDLSQKVAVDDQHLNDVSKRVEASDRKIAQYDDRRLKDRDDDDNDDEGET